VREHARRDGATSRNTDVRAIGVIGVGQLAEFLIVGAMRASAPYDFILSPRNAERSGRLAARYGLEVATGNQEVVDRADLVLVSVLPSQAEDVLSALSFRSGQVMLSAVAGVDCGDLAEWAAPATVATSMMPGLANTIGCGPSILYPPVPACVKFLETLGPVHAFDDWPSYETAGVYGAFSGVSFVFMGYVIDWFTDRGMPPETARALVAGTLRGNAEALLQMSEPLEDIVAGVATEGGFTELAKTILEEKGNRNAWHAALEQVEARLKHSEG